MPFSRTLRIRGSRHRGSATSSTCDCGQGMSSHPCGGGGGGGGGGYVDDSGGRRKGTTLGYVKCTWSQLVARCSHSRLDPGDPLTARAKADKAFDYENTQGDVSMARQRLGKAVNNGTSNGHTHHHPARARGKEAKAARSRKARWLTPAFLLKVAALGALTAVGVIFVLKHFGESGGTIFHDPDPLTSRPSEVNGGWRLPDLATVAKLDTDFCNIQRMSVKDLDPARFEKEFRYKKPVIVTFPEGANDWTDPDRWTLQELKRSYGAWEIRSGDSLEIVRQGGNGEVTSSFVDFTERLMKTKKTDTGEGAPKYYMFDREFFKDSELPATLRPPSYFSTNDTITDSIFFLGASGSGVVFHKHADTWNGVVFGRKRWFLYPITNTPPGGVYHAYTISDWYERVYPKLTSKKRPLECVQDSGEILYLPEGFYHATINVGDTIAVALQNKQATLVAEKIYYDVTELNKELNDPERDHSQVHQKLLNNFLKLHQLMPDSAEVNMKLGATYADLGQYRRAVEYLQRATDLDPFFTIAYSNLGTNLAQLRQYDKAEAALNHAIELSPNVYDAYKDLAIFLLHRARYADAIPILKKGAELKPDLLPFWTYLKTAQEQTGDLEGAKQTQIKIDQMQNK